ncbi:MAG: hypothetical protein EBV34_18980, partial [Betaproteobacteria bacterium]|nr:hypothetical protein [Betaproteobacteria bacterium]
IAAGQTTASASFSVLGDTVVEPNETVVLTMGTPTNATLGANTAFTHTIVNDDAGPLLTIRLGTVNGVSLNLIYPYTTSKGKTYYLLDLNNDGKSSSADFIGHDKTDLLFNGGNDTFDTQLTGAVAGVDDARTIVVSGYTIVQPTYDEIVALRSERAFVFPTGWQPEDYDSPNIPSATRVSPNVHYNVSFKSTNLYTNLYDGYGYNGTLFLQVLNESSLAPTVQFASTSRSANEGNSGTTTITIDAVLSAASTQTVTVPITYSGTATSGSDYINASTSITIACNDSNSSVFRQ